MRPAAGHCCPYRLGPLTPADSACTLCKVYDKGAEARVHKHKISAVPHIVQKPGYWTDAAGRFTEAPQAIAQQNATLSGYVDSTVALIEALGLVKPTVIGWSMGGNIALGLAEQYTDLFTSVVATGLPRLG